MNKLISALVAGATLVGGIAAVPAEAQRRSSFISVQGPNGRGGTLSRSVNRQPGSSTVTRSIRTNSGAGGTTTRGGSWADGSYNGGATHTTNSGKTWGRSITASANGNGTSSYSSTITGPSGRTKTVSGTVRTIPPQN